MIKLKEITNRPKMMLVFLVIITILSIHIIQAVTAEPGSDENPLVSRDYVDSKINELANKISELYNKVNSLGSTSQNSNVQPAFQVPSSKFEIVSLKPGNQLIASSGSEIILRQGKAKAIGSQLGGLNDITTGIDVLTGAEIVPNHLIIVPREDGRGIFADNDNQREVLILIKGSYIIK